MPPDPPFVEKPPEKDPFLDLLFRDGAVGLMLAALIVLLSVLAFIRWRRLKAERREQQ